MSKRKNIILFLGLVLSVSLITTSFMAILMANYYNRTQFDVLGTVCENIIEKQPEARYTVLEVLKEYTSQPNVQLDDNILSSFGYHPSDFLGFTHTSSGIFAGISFMLAALILLIAVLFRFKKESFHVKELTDYLEQVNTGQPCLLFSLGENDFSKLQDEIYKTVTMLHQAKDSAQEAKNNYSENLSNIAHQLKTPITSISLLTQVMKEDASLEYLEQIKRQLSRLTKLEESLLLLSRIDAGTLVLDKKSTDVFTILVLAADNLQELFLESNVLIDIPELGAMDVTVDLDWTMEAVMNLLKNAMEHTPPSETIHCFYEQNPLYTEILIQDEGEGFSKDDIPHLFQRFYRGKNEKSGGIGIGLSLAKEIIERQNGTIRARNNINGGACFEIRFYRH